MSKKARCIGAILIVATTILAIILIIQCRKWKMASEADDIYKVFFKDDCKDVATELLDYNGQEYTIDDYTVKLEQTLCDKQTGIGYLLFSIEKEGGKPEIKLNKDEQCAGLGFGEDERLCFDLGESFNVKYRFKGKYSTPM